MSWAARRAAADTPAGALIVACAFPARMAASLFLRRRLPYVLGSLPARWQHNMAPLDVAAWLQSHPAPGGVHITQPSQLGCWTKASAGEGGSGGGGPRVRYGDTSGLLAYAPLSLPASLEGGGYVSKEKDEDTGVEIVIRAAAAAGAPLAGCDVLTFRNNLNK